MKKGILENGQEDVEVAAALGGMRKVTAPASFEASVRSAIRERRSGSFFAAPGFLLGLKFALPAVVLMVFGAFLLFSTGDGIDDGQVAVSDTTAQPVSVDVPSDVPVSNPPSTGQADNMAAEVGRVNTQVPVNRPARVDRKAGKGREFQGGSRDFALSPDNTSIRPKGAAPDQKPDPASPSGSVSAESILSKMGISAECAENGCTAVAIRSASVAERSGMKKGDLVETIDGKPVKAGTVFEGNVIIRNVTVLRNGMRVIISLSAK